MSLRLLSPWCGLLAFYFHSLNLTSLQSLVLATRPLHPLYPPMGNCCGSAATVPSEPQPGLPVDLRPSAPVPLQPIVREESSIPSSSRPPSRPRSHSSASKRGRSSQDQPSRNRTKSVPWPPQSFQSPSLQDPKPTTSTRSAVQSKRSSRPDSRPTSPGEID